MLVTEVRRGSSIQNNYAIFVRLHIPHYTLHFQLPSDFFFCNFVSLWFTIPIFGLPMLVLPSYTLTKEAFMRREVFIAVLMKLEVFWSPFRPNVTDVSDKRNTSIFKVRQFDLLLFIFKSNCF
jgi:hypothetical protein